MGNAVLVIWLFVSVVIVADIDRGPVLHAEQVKIKLEPMSRYDCAKKAFVLNYVNHYFESEEQWSFVVKAECWEIH
ncbi:MAG: hypothetical protein V3S69_03555 [Dehalococcoidales bacterium]